MKGKRSKISLVATLHTTSSEPLYKFFFSFESSSFLSWITLMFLIFAVD
jgi:hypothetical protein